MPANPQNIPKPYETAANDKPNKKPAIRTMKSDVEELLKETKPSLVQIMGEEFTASESPAKKERAPAKTALPLRLWGILLAIAAAGGVGAYLFLSSSSTPLPSPKLVPPTPFFATETARTIEVKSEERVLFLRLLEDSIRESERQGTIKRLIVKLTDGPQERFASVRDFFNFYRIPPPSGFLDSIEPALMLFIYHSRDGTRLGLAARTTDPERTLRDLLLWETGLLRDFTPLFFDEKPEVIISPFEDRIYRNIDWRYLKLSQTEDLGIGYTIFPAGNVMVITFGKEQMETVINRLFDSR